MNIRTELNVALKAYQAGKAKPQTRTTITSTSPQPQVANTDTLSISGRGQQDSAVTKQAQTMALELEAHGSTARLDALAQQIAQGKYQVSTGSLADLLVGGDFT